MTVKVGTLSSIVNQVFTGRPRQLTEGMVYNISMADTQYSHIKGEEQLWKKMVSYLKRGADPNLRNSFGETAIQKLCDDGYHETAVKLLEEYPDLKVNVARGPTPISPLMYALRDAHVPLVKALCDHGANVNEVCTGSTISISLSTVEFLFNNITDKTKGKEADAVACAKILFDRGLAPTTAVKRRIFQHTPVLAQFMPDVQQAVDFHTALDNRDNGALKAMLDKGVPVDTGEDFGATPALHKAAAAGNLAAIDMLLAHGAPLEKGVGLTKATALHHAALGGERGAFLKLLDAGAESDTLLALCETGMMAHLDTAIKCPDPGMEDFVKDVLTQRKTPAAPSVALSKEVKRSKTLRFKARAS